MKKVIFKCRFFEIRVREAVLIGLVLIIVLLFFSIRGCEKKKIIREEAITDVCKVTTNNLSNLIQLLARADLCSEKWWKDFEAYRIRLKDQGKYLKKKTGKKEVAIYKEQKQLERALKKFEESQSNRSLKDVKKSVEAYQKEYQKRCK